MLHLGKKAKWIAGSTGAVLVGLLVFNGLFLWSSGAQLERRLEALRKAGEPVRLLDLGAGPIAPEKNGAEFVRRADADLKAIHDQLQVWYPESVYPTGTLSAEDQERLDGLFAAHPEMMPLLLQAADCPEYDLQLDVSLSPTVFIQPCMDQISKHRTVNRVLRARTALQQAQGHADDAVATQILGLRLARAWRNHPLLIGYLVSVACECSAMDGVNQVLQTASVSAATRAALDAELARHDDLDGLRGALRSERAYCLSSMRELPGAGVHRVLGFQNRLLLQLLDFFDRHLNDVSRPYADVASEQASHQVASRSWLNPLGILVDSLDPALFSTRQAAERQRACARSLRVLNALQGREIAGTAEKPKLTELGLPVETTIDPFSGQPLLVKSVGTGWKVYSVGSNAEDDEGKLDGKSDFGFGPVTTSEESEEGEEVETP